MNFFRAASAALVVALAAACSSGGKKTITNLPKTVTEPTTAVSSGAGTASEHLTFTGAIAGTMTSAHPGPQTSDSLCTNGIWDFVGPVAGHDYKVEMQMAVGYKGPGTYNSGELTQGSGVSAIQLQVSDSPDAQTYYIAVPGTVKLTVGSDERSGSVDADLRQQSAGATVHVTGDWNCLPDS